jgi:hypothetical protein
MQWASHSPSLRLLTYLLVALLRQQLNADRFGERLQAQQKASTNDT